ncbi:hypothetical protein ID866_3891 [Astraeus odoratus]|nr:hypothetical protein ID866_3891 [Astraeus odoratus]
MWSFQVVVFLALCSAQARLLYSGPEDLYAFPKSRVTFLNNFPVSNQTAQRWLTEGLKGGEREFMGDSWEGPPWYPQPSVKEISGSSDVGSLQPGTSVRSYEPTEDPEWEAFTLGRAPTALEAGAEMVVADQFPPVANLEVGHGPGTRYLVQRWGDGTYCDKTGKPREVEVQFHCSMTATDSILFVREAKTCSYVLVVQTPRLCGEPGFKSRLQTRDETLIRCRQIIDSVSVPDDALDESTQLGQSLVEEHNISLDESDYPLGLLNRESRFPIPSPAPLQGSIGANTGVGSDAFGDILRRTMEALIKNPEMQVLTGSNQQVYLNRGEDGEIIIEILEEIPVDSASGAGQGEMTSEAYSQLTDALRKAGFDLRVEAEANREGGKTLEQEDDDESGDLRDEL